MTTIFKNLPSASKNAEHLGPSYIAGGKVKWHSHCGKYLAVTYKVTHIGAGGGGQVDYKGGTGSFGKCGIVL